MPDRAFWDGRRVLVTGPNGFIAAWLIETLLDHGAVVFGYDRSPVGTLDLHPGLRDHVELVIGDLTDQPKLGTDPRQSRHPDAVSTWPASPASASRRGSPIPAFESNIRGTWSVLDAARTYGKLDTIAVASSLTAYGEQDSSPFDESFPLNGNDPYAASKACTDILARCYAASYGMPIAAARTANIFGPADPHLDHIIPGTLLCCYAASGR